MSENTTVKNFKSKSSLTRIRLTIRKPDQKTRFSFSITKDEITRTSRKQSKFSPPELTEINKKFKAKEFSFDTAYLKVLDLKEKELRKINGEDSTKNQIFLSENKKQVARLIDKISISKKGKIKSISLGNIEIDYNRILQMLGSESVYTISATELNKRMNNLSYSISVKNKLICRLNLLLRETKRDFSLSKYPTIHNEISYITEDELRELLKSFDELKDFGSKEFVKDGIVLLFYCGFREGELFAIDKANYNPKNHTYLIKKQIERSHKRSNPKNDKERKITVPTGARDSIERWFEYDESLKKIYRVKLSRVVNKVARHFFKDKSKHISNHDLRHSYAIWCLNKGLSLTDVAFLLGNCLQVCIRHYTGFVASDERLESLSAKLG